MGRNSTVFEMKEHTYTHTKKIRMNCDGDDVLLALLHRSTTDVMISEWPALRTGAERAQVVPISGPFSRTIKGKESADKWMMGWATTLHLVKRSGDTCASRNHLLYDPAYSFLLAILFHLITVNHIYDRAVDLVNFIRLSELCNTADYSCFKCHHVIQEPWVIDCTFS